MGKNITNLKHQVIGYYHGYHNINSTDTKYHSQSHFHQTVDLKLKTFYIHTIEICHEKQIMTNLGLCVKYESCIFKIEQVMAILYIKSSRNLNFTRFRFSEDSLNFSDFIPNFRMRPLNSPSNKCSTAIKGLK